MVVGLVAVLARHMRLGFCLDLADLIRYRRHAMATNSHRPKKPQSYTGTLEGIFIRISLRWSELHKAIGRFTNSLQHVLFQSRRWIFMPRIQPTHLCDASRWTVFDPLTNAQNILVNILPLDEQVEMGDICIFLCWKGLKRWAGTCYFAYIYSTPEESNFWFRWIFSCAESLEI